MTTFKPRPRVGEQRYEVEWCSKLAFYDDDESGDVDRDNCTMSVRHFATVEEAEQFAVEVYPVVTKTFGIVGVTEETFTMDDADLYPRGHWETSGDQYYFEGDYNDDGSPFFNR